MSTATLEKTPSIKSLEAAKASLRAQFNTLIDNAPESTIMKAATLAGDKGLVAVLERPAKTLSIQARNQIAINKMKDRAFETLKSACHLLDASEVCAILGVSKQALSKKTKLGYVIAYTNNRRKYYPDFQFENNKESSAVATLVQTLGINHSDESKVNILIQFLVQTMDFSNPGEEENVVPRYTLLDNNSAFIIIVRDFRNRLEMGK